MKSLDEMVEGMHAHAMAMLIGDEKAQLIPFFHIQFKDRPDTLIATPWSGEDEKSRAIRVVKEVMRQCRSSVVNYAFASEAWVATQTHRPRKGDRMPSEREDRREVVIVSAGDHQRATMKTWEIVRDDKGRPTDLVEDKTMGHATGRLYNLLDADE